MDKSKRVSVVIPTFNRATSFARYDRQCSSVSLTTISKILIADDGSIDETEALIRGRYAGTREYPLFSSVQHGCRGRQESRDQSGQGDYIAFSRFGRSLGFKINWSAKFRRCRLFPTRAWSGLILT